MIQDDPRNWECLKDGSPVQREAHAILLKSEIFSILEAFDPAHVGTIGNDIDIPGSDIDIICSAPEFSEVRNALAPKFTSIEGYTDYDSTVRGNEVFVAKIPTSPPIEIYCERQPTTEQLGYRHYLLGCRVLKLAGPAGHTLLRSLKRKGIKTEPAFATILGLTGDPYLSFLEVEKLSDTEILKLLRAHSPHLGAHAGGSAPLR